MLPLGRYVEILSLNIMGMLILCQDMCGPCILRDKEECRSQGGTRRLRTACTMCTELKKPCDPRPKWAVPIFEAMSRSKCPSEPLLISA